MLTTMPSFTAKARLNRTIVSSFLTIDKERKQPASSLGARLGTTFPPCDVRGGVCSIVY